MNSVLDYVSKAPDTDYLTITARFGTPEQITSFYLEEMDGQELAHKLSTKKQLLLMGVITALIVVLLWGAVVFSAFAEHQRSDNGFYVEEIVNVLENPSLSEGG